MVIFLWVFSVQAALSSAVLCWKILYCDFLCPEVQVSLPFPV